MPDRYARPSTVDSRARLGQPLAPIEADILARLAAGAHDTEIARALEISDRTYRRYIVAAQRKLGAKSRAHAVALAAAAGIRPDALERLRGLRSVLATSTPNVVSRRWVLEQLDQALGDPEDTP